MKITEYPAVTSLTEDQVTLLDGANGTKKVAVSDLLLGTLDLLSPNNHRLIYRGKDLGTELTSEQLANIQNGSFKDLWLGDYWTIGGAKYRIADFDYWYGYGDTKFTNHHLVIIPDSQMYTTAMNSSNNTTGGYVGSALHTSGLENAKTTISSAFGSAVLTHREYLSTEVTSGYISNGAWHDSSVELPSEIMVYGSFVHAPTNDGSTNQKNFTVGKSQLALFRANPYLISSGGSFWLRDVVSSTSFADVQETGLATYATASTALGVRPVFPIG